MNKEKVEKLIKDYFDKDEIKIELIGFQEKIDAPEADIEGYTAEHIADYVDVIVKFADNHEEFLVTFFPTTSEDEIYAQIDTLLKSSVLMYYFGKQY